MDSFVRQNISVAKEVFQDAYEFSAALCPTAAAVPQYQW